MDFFGVLQADRLLFVAPLFLLPIAIALCTDENRYLRRTLAVALLVTVGVGWFGTYARRYYATARFAEPWSSLSADTAGAIQQGAGLISNSPSLFLYLTYDLGKPDSANPDRISQVRPTPPASTSGFSGFLPNPVRNSQVWSADDWKAAGQPTRAYMIWMDAASSRQIRSRWAMRLRRSIRNAAGAWRAIWCAIPLTIGRSASSLNSTRRHGAWRSEYLCQGAAPPATPPELRH